VETLYHIANWSEGKCLPALQHFTVISAVNKISLILLRIHRMHCTTQQLSISTMDTSLHPANEFADSAGVVSFRPNNRMLSGDAVSMVVPGIAAQGAFQGIMAAKVLHSAYYPWETGCSIVSNRSYCILLDLETKRCQRCSFSSCSWGCCYHIFNVLRLCRFSTGRYETFHTY